MFVALALVISACSFGGSCVDDNFCSSTELLRGGCNDCRPDFAVGEVYLNYLSDGSANVFYCIDNINGQYDGDLDVYVNVGGIAQPYDSSAPLEQVSFSSAASELYATTRNVNGISMVDFNLRYGDQDERICSSFDFTAEPSREYWVSVWIDPSNTIEEIDDGNNQFTESFLTGVEEHYPGVLLEYDLGDYRYFYSDLFGENDMQHYLAYYTKDFYRDETSYSVWADVAVLPSAARAKTLGAELADGAEPLVLRLWSGYADMGTSEEYPVRKEYSSEYYYATVYYKQFSESMDSGAFYLVSWVADEKVVSATFFIPAGWDVVDTLSWDYFLQRYAAIYMPDDASLIPAGCWDNMDLVNQPEAKVVCEAQGGKIEKLSRESYSGDTCYYTTCTLPASPFIEVTGYEMSTYDYMSYSEFNDMPFLSMGAYYSGSDGQGGADVLLSKSAADAQEIMRLVVADEGGLYDAARKVVVFDGAQAYWTNGAIIRGVYANDWNYASYTVEQFKKLTDYAAWYNMTVTRQFNNPLLKAYLKAYPSDLALGDSTCQFTKYPRDLLSRCTRFGGKAVAIDAGACSVPGCEFTAPNGSACQSVVPTDAEIKECTSNSWYEITTANGCPQLVCRPQYCEYQQDLWQTCNDQGLQVLSDIGADGCWTSWCGTCEYKGWDSDTEEACSNGGGEYLYVPENGCGNYKCVWPPLMN